MSHSHRSGTHIMSQIARLHSSCKIQFNLFLNRSFPLVAKSTLNPGILKMGLCSVRKKGISKHKKYNYDR